MLTTRKQSESSMRNAHGLGADRCAVGAAELPAHVELDLLAAIEGEVALAKLAALDHVVEQDILPGRAEGRKERIKKRRRKRKKKKENKEKEEKEEARRTECVYALRQRASWRQQRRHPLPRTCGSSVYSAMKDASDVSKVALVEPAAWPAQPRMRVTLW